MMPYNPDLAWKQSSSRCCLGIVAFIEIILSVVILGSEILNITIDFWHSNVFGGIWASLIIFLNYTFVCGTVCCMAIHFASSCALAWNVITLLALTILIVFDVIFILNPSTCLLTSTCSSQTQIVSLDWIIQLIPFFKNYSTIDLKRLFLIVQVTCAGIVFILSLGSLVILSIAKAQIRQRVAQSQACYQMKPSAPPHPTA